MTEKFKVDLIYGTAELFTFHKFENGRMITYGYAIHRNRNGAETHRTEPTPLASLGLGNGKPFTKKDYCKLLNT